MSNRIIRISLFVSLIAGLIALGAGYSLKSSRTKFQTELGETKEQLTLKISEAKKSRDEKEKALADLQESDEKLTATTSELDQKKSEFDAQQNKIKEIEDKLSLTAKELDEKKADIEKIVNALPPGTTIEQVQAQLKDYHDQLTTLEQEKKILNESLVKLETDLKNLRDHDQRKKDGKMPEGLTGHILALNEDWNFVVIDVGANQGVVENAAMIVYRNGTLIGKVKISSVEPTISIADILPEWKQADIREGDTVVF